MRMLVPRTLIAAALVWGFLAPSARAYPGLGWAETVYVSPTSSVLAVPTSYVVESSYVPTSYVLPTSYSYVVPSVYYPTAYTYASPTYYVSPTSYLLPTTYASTVYVPRRWFRRGYYATSLSYVYPTSYYYPTAYYSPTSYYVPTTVSYPVVATSATYASSIGCDPCAVPSAPARVVAPPPASSGTTNTSNNGGGISSSVERQPSGVIESQPAGSEPPYTSQVPGSGGATPPAPGASGSATSPAAPQAPAPDQNEAPAPTGGGATPGTNPGAATIPNIPTVPPSETMRRTAQRPSNLDAEVRMASLYRGALEGRVLDAESQQPEAGARVFVSDHRRRFDDRVATADSRGHFVVANLPEGDWTVAVETRSGRRYPVSEITVGSGKITDSYGRDVPSLTIRR